MMVMFLTSTEEKVLERRQLAVPIAEPRIYIFPKLPSGQRINASLTGAFLASETVAEQQKQRLENKNVKFIKTSEQVKENYIRVFLQSVNSELVTTKLTTPRLLAVTKPQDFDTTNMTKIPIMFDIGEGTLDTLEEEGHELQLVIESNFTKTPEDKKQEMPLMFIYDIAPINRQIGVIFAAGVLIFLYALIIWEVSLL